MVGGFSVYDIQSDNHSVSKGKSVRRTVGVCAVYRTGMRTIFVYVTPGNIRNQIMVFENGTLQ